MIPWLLVLGVGALVAVATLTANRLRGQQPSATSDAVKAILAAFSALFVFSFAFLFNDAYRTIADGRKAVYTEAHALRDVVWASSALPSEQKADVRDAMRTYLTEVIDHEWPLMRSEQTSTTAQSITDDLRVQLADWHPVQPQAQNARQDVLDAVVTLADARRDRVVLVHAGLPTIMIGMLIGAAAMTLIAMVVIGVPSTPQHISLIAMVGAMFTFGIYLITQLNHPFSGAIGVPPDALREAVQRIQQIR